jgi:hypothetical protein
MHERFVMLEDIQWYDIWQKQYKYFDRHGSAGKEFAKFILRYSFPSNCQAFI